MICTHPGTICSHPGTNSVDRPAFLEAFRSLPRWRRASRSRPASSPMARIPHRVTVARSAGLRMAVIFLTVVTIRTRNVAEALPSVKVPRRSSATTVSRAASWDMVRSPNSSPAADQGSSAPAWTALRRALVRAIRISPNSSRSTLTSPNPSRPRRREPIEVGLRRTRGGISRRTAAWGTSASRSRESRTRWSDPYWRSSCTRSG